MEEAVKKFVKTIYVSGFSGYVKEQQVQLPEWAESSDFTGVNVVTGASIDVGYYLYVWDLKDYSGNKVKLAEYLIKVEVHY